MKPRFRAESVVLSEQLLILVSCCWRPMSRNSVLAEFNVTRLAVIHEDLCCRAFWRWVTDESKSGGRRQYTDCRWFNEKDEIRVLRGDVYIMKSGGPRTEPWGLHISRHVRRKSNCHIWRGRKWKHDMAVVKTMLHGMTLSPNTATASPSRWSKDLNNDPNFGSRVPLNR